MQRIKRKLDDIVHNNDNNKKQKLLVTTNKFHFENLANEIIYEIFEYLDVYDIYYGFYYLNNRFKNLVSNSNIHFQVNISTISKSNFESYHENVIKPNKHRIKILRLSNSFTVDIIFSPPRIICDFIQLEKLIFDNIHSKYLNNILKHLIHLPKLHSLVLSPIDNIQNPSFIFTHIFDLTKLKYCKIKYNEHALPIDFDECKQSSIEYLIIDSPFRYESFKKLLICLPKLRHLSINSLIGSNHAEIDFYPIVLKDLKYVSFGLCSINFHQFEMLIKNFFNSIEILHISTYKNSAYSRAKQWEELISSSMPNLRIFDLQNHYTEAMDRFLYLCLSGQYKSKFWIEKQWFFEHEHDCHESSNNGIFFSTNPYRRKDYTFHWGFHDYNHLHSQKRNFKSVKHIYICGKRAVNNSASYFPNVTELTVKNYARTYHGSIFIALDQIIPLKQLSKLIIDCNDFPIKELLNLISLTPNLRTLKWNFQSIDETKSKLIQQSEIFQSTSSTNKIQNLEIFHCCSLEEINFVVNLFPQLECLKTGICRKEIVPITRCILSKMHHLFYLCITDIPKTYLQKFNVLIKSENLLDDYFIKFVDHDLYFWW
ncbi:unnamed protein product [Rotaria socialis]|uniref:F-box domain-containing protein n=2 Tax=Rotaria TaxID=231623 RepID=A0A816WN56_9BILA|nr:unnamed protein product [Rotaria magnacalcarata]CAF3366333.1 unnamed protein product [Rotaria socialis]CAF1682332.1 unnamed protein product [Rotaria magnacalcarata]CAF2131206.1 unnamed protein product [Rotaria magnacalcarata]CAF3396554.1 unnamed protein product [Rotaria socialis]